LYICTVFSEIFKWNLHAQYRLLNITNCMGTIHRGVSYRWEMWKSILTTLQYRKREKSSVYCATVAITRNTTMRSGKASSKFRFNCICWEIEAYHRDCCSSILRIFSLATSDVVEKVEASLKRTARSSNDEIFRFVRARKCFLYLSTCDGAFLFN